MTYKAMHKTICVPSPRVGPAWHRVVRHPETGGMVRIVREDEARHYVACEKTGWHRAEPPLTTAQALRALWASTWPDEDRDLMISPDRVIRFWLKELGVLS